MPDSNRLEREIEEILGKIERFPEARSRRQRAWQQAARRVGAAISSRQQAVARELARFSLSQVMLLSFLMILGAFFFRRVSPLAMNWLTVAGIVLFVSSFAILTFSGGHRRAAERNWRGRTVRYATGPALAERLRQWWRSRSVRR